jgi:antitoxin component of MazEF toxin-antitoxin module
VVYDLDAMLGQVTPENRHSEADWGRPVGKEIW